MYRLDIYKCDTNISTEYFVNKEDAEEFMRDNFEGYNYEIIKEDETTFVDIVLVPIARALAVLAVLILIWLVLVGQPW